ncbi:MAG: HDOD domain-containing protein [Syntrophomonadaceae bacterium]|jgi:putative nucleotidyltransferase with HDIG domain|nr:HDOD domain-containing protein [Syntrophomonadaceae bacterium]MDH7498004.1 HDOD domain-containing protein [Syntrophomonadaceae bacterium]
MEKMSLSQVVAAVEEIPALPQVLLRVMKVSEDPNSTAQDMHNVITQDQGLTARVLRLANSAFYGFPRRINTVTEATVLLGFRTIRSIALAASVSDLLGREVAGYALAPGELWRHSQASAIAARHLARTLKHPNPEVAYTAALLHDIGKVVLNRYLQAAYHQVLETVTGSGLSFSEAEERVLGFTHAQVGARVADKWNLPPELVEAIACHHLPEEAQVDPLLTALVHVADAVAMMMGLGLGVDGLAYPLSPLALERLGLDEPRVEALMAQLADMFADENSFLV